MSEADVDVAEVVAPEPARKPSAMDRFIDGIELIAAFFVGIVALDIFVSVMLRYFFSVQIPDSYDFGRLLLGILIFWGIAATSLSRHSHHRRSLYANVGAAHAALHRRVRHAGAVVRGDGADLHLVRQGA